MIKQVTFGTKGRKKLKKGADTIANAVKVTLGQAGRNVLISSGWDYFNSTKDGVTVAKSIYVSDQVENVGANIIREAAIKTVYDAGDGTTSSTVLCQAIIERGMEALERGANPVELKNGIEKAVK